MICGLLGFLLWGLSAARAQESVEVLIIDSYHPGYTWSDGELRGVLHSLLAAHPRLLPGVEYLDWIRHPTPENEQRFLDLLNAKYAGQKLKLVITLDDKALQLALEHRALFGRDIPIVFGGVNYFTPELLHGQTNITGVAETKDISRTLDLIHELQPGVREIVVYHDDTTSSLANRRELDAALPRYTNAFSFRFLDHWSETELLDDLGQLRRGTAVLGLGATRDRDGRQLSSDTTFLKSIAVRSTVPVYIISEPIVQPFSTGNWESAIWTGVGGSLVSSDAHGELVGDMANRVLAGTPADSIPVVTHTPTRLAVDWLQMKRFNLPIHALPAGTEIYHEPQSYYRINKSRIIAGAVILGVAAVVLLILGTNVALRRRAERQNLRLAAAVQEATEIILMLDARGNVLYVNPAFTQLTGRTLAEARQPDFLRATLHVTDDFAGIQETLRRQKSWAGRSTCTHPEGRVLELSLVASAVPAATEAEVSYLIMGRDVTRENRLEQQLRNSQKMEAVGLLAGGVAHDFNNLLQIIGGHTHLALDPQSNPTEQRECLEQVLEASDRAAQLTRQLLAFGRRQSLQREDIDLNRVIGNLLKMLRRVIGEHLSVEFTPCRGLENIYADRGQMEQVLLNLCVNARDAMPGGGRLMIAVENANLTQAFCDAHPWARPGHYVLLRAADTGCGMDQKTLARIFEPFFTTKRKDQGNGLGLAVVHGIIEQHGGFIHVYSEPGSGTSFQIYLPVAERKPAAPAERGPVDNALVQPAVILLVEDEPAVRDLATRVLRKKGHTVFTASNGAEAVQMFTEHAPLIQLIVMDVVMPLLNGPEAYARISAIRPGVPIIYCSGYSADVLRSGFELNTDEPLLQKPYEPGQLLARIARSLAQAPPPEPPV